MQPGVRLRQGRPTHLPIYTKVGNIDDDPELEIFHKHMGTEFLAWNHDGTAVPGYSVYADTTMHGKMLLAQLDGDANDELFIGHEGTGQINKECEVIVDRSGSS